MLCECMDNPPKATIPLIRLKERRFVCVNSLQPLVISSMPYISAFMYKFMLYFSKMLSNIVQSIEKKIIYPPTSTIASKLL